MHWNGKEKKQDRKKNSHGEEKVDKIGQYRGHRKYLTRHGYFSYQRGIVKHGIDGIIQGIDREYPGQKSDQKKYGIRSPGPAGIPPQGKLIWNGKPEEDRKNKRQNNHHTLALYRSFTSRRTRWESTSREPQSIFR